MGNIGEPITPSVPVVGSAGPQFATDINAILTEIVARLSAKVPLSSISTNTTLNMTGSPITNVGYLTLADVLSAPGASPVNRLTTYQGNLYYVAPGGAIQLTTGIQLNAAAIGGITGDYTSAGPMQFRYTTATTRYDAYSDFAAGNYAYLRARGLDINASINSGFFARLQFSGPATVTYTLPTAAATSQQMPLYMDNTGQITVGHGSRNITLSGMNMTPSATGASALAVLSLAANRCGTQNATAGSVSAVKSLEPIPVGYAFTSVNIYLQKGNANSFSARLFKQTTTGLATQMATNNTSVVGQTTLVLTPGATETAAAGTYYWVEVTFSATAFAETVMGFDVVGSSPP